MTTSITVGQLRQALAKYHSEDVVAVLVDQSPLTPEMAFGILEVEDASGEYGFELAIKVGVLE